MSIESAKVLRNGKVLTDSLSQSPSKNTNLNLNPNMESSSNSADEINQSGRNSPTIENSTQRENEERFDRLHNEIAMLKAMMEKIISQNEERDKQNGGSTATSSYAVGTSTVTFTECTTELFLNICNYRSLKSSCHLRLDFSHCLCLSPLDSTKVFGLNPC